MTEPHVSQLSQCKLLIAWSTIEVLAGAVCFVLQVWLSTPSSAKSLGTSTNFCMMENVSSSPATYQNVKEYQLFDQEVV